MSLHYRVNLKVRGIGILIKHGVKVSQGSAETLFS